MADAQNTEQTFDSEESVLMHFGAYLGSVAKENVGRKVIGMLASSRTVLALVPGADPADSLLAAYGKLDGVSVVSDFVNATRKNRETGKSAPLDGSQIAARIRQTAKTLDRKDVKTSLLHNASGAIVAVKLSTK